MPTEVDAVLVGAWPPVEQEGISPCEWPLGTALAESVAKRHGGEIRLRSCGDGGVLVELRFPIPARPA
jgi:hypothetical protein